MKKHCFFPSSVSVEILKVDAKPLAPWGATVVTDRLRYKVVRTAGSNLGILSVLFGQGVSITAGSVYAELFIDKTMSL